MTKRMKGSTVELMRVIFWGAGALAWLPAAAMDLPGTIFSTLCAAACARHMVRYLRDRKEAYEG